MSEAWPPSRSPEGRGPTPAPQVPAEAYPVPEGRGRWRLAVHSRQFTTQPWQGTLISEIVGARGVRLEKTWNGAAKLTLTLDGHHPTTALIEELQTDLFAWRWDEWAGVDRCMFRGVVTQSLDQLTENVHTVNFVAFDYAKVLERRLLTNSYSATNIDQDDIVDQLLERAKIVRSSSGALFYPGSYLPLDLRPVGPSGLLRPPTGVGRDRAYPAQANIAELINNLANVIGGFDWDVLPAPVAGTQADQLRIFWPYQGVVRDTPLVYGPTVAALTRSINASSYANYWRTVGYQMGETSDEPQLFGEVWNPDVNDPSRIPIGTWMGGDNAPDVTEQDTVDQKAAGQLDRYGGLDRDGHPTGAWTVRLRPGAYGYGRADIGDVVPLIVQSGRLDLQTEIRILGMSFAVGPDGEEDVELEVGRPAPGLFAMLTRADADVDAVVRREVPGGGVPETPVGAMIGWPGATPPDATWRWCDGMALSRNTYPELFDVIGYTYGGAGDLYNLPDTRGRMMVGAGQGTDLTNRPRGAIGGGEMVTITAATMPAHTHTGPSHAHAVDNHTHNQSPTTGTFAAHNHGVFGQQDYNQFTVGGIDLPGGGSTTVLTVQGAPVAHNHSGFTSDGGAHTHPLGGTTGGSAPNTNQAGTGATGSVGLGQAHQNMPPFIAINQVIRVLPPRSARRSA
jgi:microcystin-dependent protein